MATLSTNLPNQQHKPKYKNMHDPSDFLLKDVYMPSTRTKVIFFQSSKPTSYMTSISQKLTSKGYISDTVSVTDEVMSRLKTEINQVVLVLGIQDALQPNMENLLRRIQSETISSNISIMAVVTHKSRHQHHVSEAMLSSLVTAGVSRILSADDGEDKFFQELKLTEMNELRMKKLLQFSNALKEAVDNSHDAIQVTGKDSSIVYVNKSFLELNGYTTDECIGKPATDILRCYDSKWVHDNGMKIITLNDHAHPWEGHCVSRRKSGSVTKQYFKLLPVAGSTGLVAHHVTIQRLLSTHEVSSHDVLRGGLTSPKPSYAGMECSSTHSLSKSNSRGSLGIGAPRTTSEAPLLKAVHTIALARDNPDCPMEIRDSLEKSIEILRTAQLYSPQLLSTGKTRGFVEGLINEGARFGAGFIPDADTSKGPYTPTHHNPQHHAIAEAPPPTLQEHLTAVATWDFDILQLEHSTTEPLYYVGLQIFCEFNMCEVLDVDEHTIGRWLKLMENNYRKNSYHNSTHAADVLQGTAYLIRALNATTLDALEDRLDPFEIASLLISAVVHDIDHPGRTNPFLANSQSELALLYNDRAVLENYHAAYSFRITLQSKQHNIFSGLEKTSFRKVRGAIIDLVLATDMAKHFEHLAKFKGIHLAPQDDLLNAGSTTSISGKEHPENRMLMKRVLVKCADIANACRPRSLCTAWAAKIADEYFSQTEEEKEKGLPVVFPDFDRNTCKLPVTQVKFIEYIVSGLFEAWNSYCPVPTLMEHLSSNYEYWKSLYDSPNSSEGETENSP